VDVLAVVLIALALAAVVAFVGAPLRRRAGEGRHEPDSAAGASEEASRAGLETAKEAKYREIRDAELDYRTGKLSEDDYAALDATLRAEAIEILARLDERDSG
jgi:hypothetical protein